MYIYMYIYIHNEPRIVCNTIHNEPMIVCNTIDGIAYDRWRIVIE